MNVPADRFRPRTNYTTIMGLSSTLRMPRLGKIRLGVKVKKAKADGRCKHAAAEVCLYCTYPKDVDYFVCPPEVQAIYGAQPKELEVLIPCEDQSLYFPQSLKCYKGNRLWCKGNGREATRIDMTSGALSQVDCPCEHYGDDCGERANLMILLPKVGMGGAYQIDTGSTANIIELNSTIAWLRGMIGRIAFVPLILKRIPTVIQFTEKGGAVKTTTKALLKLEFQGDFKRIAALRERDVIAIEGGGGPVPLALPPRAVEDGEDDAPGAIIIEEEEKVHSDPASEGAPAAEATAEEKGGVTPSDPEGDPFPDDELQAGDPVIAEKAYILGASTSGEAIKRYKEVAEKEGVPHDRKIELQGTLNERLKELKVAKK